jgi:hypothetical protein
VERKDPKRQTGRTTRMLQEACRLRDEGRTVYVLMATERQARLYDRRPAYVGLRFETWNTLRGSIDEERMVLRNAHPNCVLLVDHYAIEDRYRAALVWLTKFDAE